MNNPYAPPTAHVADPATAFVDVQYAGFWMRFVAFFIDGILLSVIIIPLILWIYGAEIFTAQDELFVPGPAYYLITTVLPIVATLLFWKYRQATPGKMLLGLKIVNAKTLGALSTGQLFGRYFAYIVSMIPAYLGFFWIGWDARKQSWHDKLAGTLVIRK
jgi:uncharacterized RDD family membrane protein YckC